MFLFYSAIGLTIASNVVYHVFQKQIPGGINPMVSLIVTYLTAAAVCLAIFPFYPSDMPLGESIKKLNWASALVGISIIGLELGFLLAYRAGWNISLAAAVSNVTVTILLVPIGLMLFKEKLTATNAIGVAVCIVGLILINKR